MWFSQPGFQSAYPDVPHGPVPEAAAPEPALPHLMQYLWDRYLEHIQQRLAQRRAEGKPTIEFAQAIRKAPASDFAYFAADYLRRNRPQQAFWSADNVGITLGSTAVSLLVAPPAEAAPAQPEALPITGTSSGEPVESANWSSSWMSLRW